jgi:trehalose 6-phosphate phosphatase
MALATWEEILAATEPFREAPRETAGVWDVDGVLAPIVDRAEDSEIPSGRRELLRQFGGRFATQALLSGRRSADARRLAMLETIWALGLHGVERLAPGAIESVVDRRLAPWAARVEALLEFVDSNAGDLLAYLGVRPENKQFAGAWHWRGSPQLELAEKFGEFLEALAQAKGFNTRNSMQTMEFLHTVPGSKADGVIWLVYESGARRAFYVGDGLTDVDAFRGLDVLVDEGALSYALRVGVSHPEVPTELVEAADIMVDGPAGVDEFLRALLHD